MLICSLPLHWCYLEVRGDQYRMLFHIVTGSEIPHFQVFTSRRMLSVINPYGAIKDLYRALDKTLQIWVTAML